jgi:hypothetical protein
MRIVDDDTRRRAREIQRNRSAGVNDLRVGSSIPGVHITIEDKVVYARGLFAARSVSRQRSHRSESSLAVEA